MTKYYLHPDIKWKAFKAIQDAVNKHVKERGPYPMHLDKNLWEMLRKRAINMFLDTEDADPLVITTKPIPKKALFLK